MTQRNGKCRNKLILIKFAAHTSRIASIARRLCHFRQFAVRRKAFDDCNVSHPKAQKFVVASEARFPLISKRSFFPLPTLEKSAFGLIRHVGAETRKSQETYLFSGTG